MKKYIVLFILMIIFFAFGITAEASFRGSFSSGSHVNPSTATIHISVPPNPMYEDLWKVENVESTLSVAKTNTNTSNKYQGTKEEAEFLVENHGHGRIIIFPNRKKAWIAHTEIINLNISGEEYSWSFSKDNVVLLLDSGFPEVIARELEAKLYAIKEFTNKN